jgi:riboflavin kinase/FMN adenylyltransferase
VTADKNIIRTDSVEGLARAWVEKVALAIGVFDGVHTGHRLLLSTLTDMSRRTGALPAVMTFSPHPRAALSPGSPPKLLCPDGKKISVMAGLGVRAAGI